MRFNRRARLIAILALAAMAAIAVYTCRPTMAADPMTTPVTPGQLEIIGAKGRAGGACPLKHTDVDVRISGFIARVNVVQQFQNPTGGKIEAVYTFPLAEDSAVDRMEMKVGNRVIIGQIHRREEAREIYEQARAAGQVASLLDQERPNIFTQSVANIEPGAEVTITISYTQLLKYEAGTYKFSFPTVVGPRFNPGTPVSRTGTGMKPDTTQVPDASKITPRITPQGTRAGHDISIKVNINSGVPLLTAKCETHDVNYEFPDKSSATITLKDEATIPNKDFVVNYQVAGEQIQSGLISYAPVKGQGGWFSLIMQPPKAPTQSQITPKEMIFVIDTSGSQMGEPLAKSKETMFHCIRNVNPGDTFNMISFSNEVNKLFETPQPYTADTLAKAEEFLKKCESGGGTYMLPAMKAALEPAPDPKRLRIVVFFTDGYVGNDFELVDCVQKNAGNARVFPFGIGNSVNRFLLEKMGEVGRGSTDIVLLNGDSKAIAEKFYDKIRSPLLTDITVDWHGLPVDASEIYPKQSPDLFASQPLILKGRFTDAADGEVTVHGKIGGQPWSSTFRVNLPNAELENDSLASIWARAKVEDLMSQDWMGAQTGKPKTDVKEAVIKVALAYGLMTQYTSFVAVETTTVTSGGQPRTIAVPVEMPEGVSYQGIGLAEEKQLYMQRRMAPSGAVGGSAGFGGAMASSSLALKAMPAAIATPAPSNGPVAMNGLVVAGDRTTTSGQVSLGHGYSTATKPAAPSEQRRLSVTYADGFASKAKDKSDARGSAKVDSLRATKTEATTNGMFLWPEGVVDARPYDLDNSILVKNNPNAVKQFNQIVQRMDKSLVALVVKFNKSGGKGDYSIPGKLIVKNGKVEVLIWVKDATQAKMTKLESLGLTGRSWVLSKKVLIGFVPVKNLTKMTRLGFVNRIAPPTYIEKPKR